MCIGDGGGGGGGDDDDDVDDDFYSAISFTDNKHIAIFKYNNMFT